MKDIFYEILGYVISFSFLGYFIYLFIKTVKRKR